MDKVVCWVKEVASVTFALLQMTEASVVVVEVCLLFAPRAVEVWKDVDRCHSQPVLGQGE
jgi:hypothetical protein